MACGGSKSSDGHGDQNNRLTAQKPVCRVMVLVIVDKNTWRKEIYFQ